MLFYNYTVFSCLWR